MKKIISALLALVMSALFATASFASSYEPPAVQLPDWMDTAAPRFRFTDVSKKSWYFKYVWYVVDHDIMNGRTAESFEPGGNMSRAEFVTLLFRLDGAEPVYTNDFKDVKSGSWYAPYVGWGVSVGLVNGITKDTFEPNAKITREQVATLLSRYIELRDISIPSDESAPESFTDASKISSWAKSHVQSLRQTGLFVGDNAGNFNPKKNMTRAEAAALISRFSIAQDAAKLASSEAAVYNANMMWCLEKAFVAPSASVEGNLYSLGGDSFTLNWRNMFADPSRTPVIRLYYTGGVGDVSLKLNIFTYSTNPPIEAKSYTLSVSPASDGEYRVIDADFTEIMAEVRSFYADETENFIANPSYGCYGDIYDFMRVSLEVNLGSDDAKLLALLISDSKDKIDAKSLEDVLEYATYNPADDIFYGEVCDEITEQYMSEAEEQIEKIMNAESIDPDTIKGTCYYISSLNGDDSNNGLSPESAWATVNNLYETRAGGLVFTHLLKAGDGVFFERGSTFYGCEKLKTNYSGDEALRIPAGVTVSAYGEGEKPLFSHAYQTKTPAGEWSATEHPNIWKLDELIVGTELCPGYRRICNIVVNCGEMYGIGVSGDNPLTPGSTAVYRGIVTNGRDIFESGGNSFEDITVLRNNLEFYHNGDTGELFMYYDGGNPGEVFDDIKLSQWGSLIRAGGDIGCKEPTVIDNIAVKYTGRHGMEVSGNNLTVQNCEVAWIGGINIGNGIENWGSCNGYTVKNNYIYQCYDDNITSQFAGDYNGEGQLMENILFSGNVLTHSTAAFELWNSNIADDGENRNSYSEYVLQNSIVRNAEISGNYMLYMGYGFGHQRVREYEPRKGAKFLDCAGWSYQQFSNVVFENNVGIHSTEHVNYIQQVNEPGNAPYRARGVKTRNNVYIVSDTCYYTRSDLGHPMTFGRTLYGYNERTLAYLTGIGIETGTKFYYYKGYLSKAEAETGVYR